METEQATTTSASGMSSCAKVAELASMETEQATTTSASGMSSWAKVAKLASMETDLYHNYIC